MPLALDEAEGYLKIDVIPLAPGADGGTIYLDLFAANNAYAGLCESEDDAHARGEAWCKWLATKGLNLSHGTAFRVAEAVMREVGEFKKKFGVGAPSETPASPASTASPSAT